MLPVTSVITSRIPVAIDPHIWTSFLVRVVLTGFGVRVTISLSAAVGRRLLVVLLLGEAEGERLGGAGRAAGLLVPQPAVTTALLGAIWQMERHTALGLEHNDNRRHIISQTNPQ